jgi:hypothetical protein
MVNARAVSAETLASIPWMSAKSLSHAMREVSLRGPYELETWMRLISRADMISPSFSAKQSALVLNSLARVMDLPDLVGSFDAFVKRYVRRFLVNIIQTCSPLDTAQLVHAVGEFNQCFTDVDEHAITSLLSSLRANIPLMQDRELSMTACGLFKLQNSDPVTVTLVIRAALRLGNQLSDQSLAQIVNLAAHSQPGSRSDICDLVTKMIIETRDRMIDMNPRTMAVLLTSLAKLRLSNPECISLLCDSLNSSSNPRLRASSFQTLVLILRSLQKLGVGAHNPLVLHSLIDIMNSRRFEDESTGNLCMYVNAVSRMKGYDAEVITCLRQILGREVTPAQVVLVLQSTTRVHEGEKLAGLIVQHLKTHSHSFSQDQVKAISAAIDASSLGEFHMAREILTSRA